MSSVSPAPAPQLNPVVAFDAAANCRSNQRWNVLLTTAALVSAVAFIALAVTASLYVSLYMPEHLLLAGLIIMISLPISNKIFQSLWNKATICSDYSKEARLVAERVKNEPLDADKLKKKISGLGVQAGNATPSQLASLIARYEHDMDKVSSIEKQIKDLQEKIKEAPIDGMTKSDFSDPMAIKKYTATQKGRILIDRLKDEVIRRKIDAAFYLKLMKNPYLDQPKRSFFKPVRMPHVVRLVAKQHGEKGTDVFLKTSTYNYTRDQLLSYSPAKIAKWVFA